MAKRNVNNHLSEIGRIVLGGCLALVLSMAVGFGIAAWRVPAMAYGESMKVCDGNKVYKVVGNSREFIEDCATQGATCKVGINGTAGCEVGCTEGETRCVDNKILAVCNKEDQGNMHWDEGPCLDGVKCEGGRCVCEQDTKKCLDSNMFYECKDGEYSYATCTLGTRCENGECVCVIDNKRCIDKTSYQVCANGERTVVSCDAGKECVMFAGEPTCAEVGCTEGENRCVDSKILAMCNKDDQGNTYWDEGPCLDGLKCEDGRCVCEQDIQKCIDSKRVYECKDGKYSYATCGDNEVCVNGACECDSWCEDCE